MPQLGSRKSRTGCRRCKQRRVKCDEQAPCGTCVRRNETCSLYEATLSHASGVTTELILPNAVEDWTLDLELMHHYITSLGRLGVRKDIIQLWRDTIPQQAFQHSFLMHGLLAFAALHLAYVQPDNSVRYLQACDKHQAVALETFRAILSSPFDPSLADALFALSGLLSISSMARSCARPGSRILDMDTITELFMLTRGVRHVIQLSRESIQAGPLAAMLEPGPGEVDGDPRGELPASLLSSIETVRNMLCSYGMDEDSLYHCQTALTELSRIYRSIVSIVRTSPLDIGDVSRWQVFVSMGYIWLIQARSAPALVVLAYYAAAMTGVRTAWYTQTWAEYALHGISEELPPAMQELIQWPRQQVHDRLSKLGVRSPDPAEFEREPTPVELT